MENIEITPKHLAVLLDITPVKALMYFDRAALKRPDCEGTDEEKIKYWIKEWYLPIESLSKALGIDLLFILDDVKNNFCKNRECVEYGTHT